MKGFSNWSFEGVWGFMLIFQVMKGFSNWCGPGFTALYAQGAVLSHWGLFGTWAPIAL